jgi:hypothetical protein
MDHAIEQVWSRKSMFSKSCISYNQLSLYISSPNVVLHNYWWTMMTKPMRLLASVNHQYVILGMIMNMDLEIRHIVQHDQGSPPTWRHKHWLNLCWWMILLWLVGYTWNLMSNQSKTEILCNNSGLQLANWTMLKLYISVLTLRFCYPAIGRDVCNVLPNIGYP